ncbi:MAG: 3-methyladenine glycosylase [Arthrobacter sp.]|nr:3-methyladenine glycosylase [Arthrobacter sp.]
MDNELQRNEVREFLTGDARKVAPLLLGSVLTHHSADGPVSVRITELEAYMGPGDSLHPDPGSHTFRGPAVLLRAGEVVDGLPLAAARRPTSRSPKDLASGPARLATALGLTTADSGRDALVHPFGLELATVPAGDVSSGPRVGVAGDGGTHDYPWRFWLTGDPTVSRYKAAKVRAAWT